MKRMSMQWGLIAVALILGLLPSLAIGNPRKDATEKSSTKKIEQNTQDQTEEKRKKIMQEASSAISETHIALTALDDGKKADALAALERATGKLEIILAREPKLALAPMGVSAATYDVLADTNAVKSLRGNVENLINEGRLQEARHIIRNLASETVISVTNIPLATYPLAIKEAVRLIDENKESDAKLVLQTALNTLVVTDTVVPLPVVAAQEMLKEAEKLAENKERKDDESKRLTEVLKEARTQLEFAQVLGYGTKGDFKDLYEQLTEIEQKTESGKSGVGFFEKIKASIAQLFSSSQPATPNQSQVKNS